MDTIIRRGKSVEERILEAEDRSSRWLAECQKANEAGNNAYAKDCSAKSAYWFARLDALKKRVALTVPGVNEVHSTAG